MPRIALALSLLLLAAPAALAQDMPLSMFLIEGEGWRPADSSPAPKDSTKPRDIGGRPTRAVAASPDGGTVFAEHPDGTAVWAYAVGKDGSLTAGEPYCPLRLRKGETKLQVTGLTVDAAGRVYAATADGVQVFDPTGRLCGVLLLPAKGETGLIGWEGERRELLTLRVGGAKYVRRLNTSGVR